MTVYFPQDLVQELRELILDEENMVYDGSEQWQD